MAPLAVSRAAGGIMPYRPWWRKRPPRRRPPLADCSYGRSKSRRAIPTGVLHGQKLASARFRCAPIPDLPAVDTLRRKRWGGRPPTASTCQSGGVEHHSKEASVGEVSTIGLDVAKLVFQAYGADASGGVVFRKKLRRDQVLAFFAGQPRCVVAMEA